MSVSNYVNINIKLFNFHKDFKTKRENILLKLAFMSTFEEISSWVKANTNGQKYIACSSHATLEDRNSCLNCVQELLYQAVKGVNKRKDGRDLKLTKAAKVGDYYTIASILASAAWSYWQTYLFASGNAVFCAKNHQKNQQKIEFQKAQIEHIGAAIGFQKARKKGAYQEIIDFEETIKIVEDIFEN